MIGLQITVQDGATPALKRVEAFLASAGARNCIGRAAVDCVQGHLDGLEESRPNLLAGVRTHYWSSARKATNYREDNGGVTVSVAQVGMRLHYLGGTVNAGKGISSFTGKPTVYLAIPACAEAHGKRPSDFPDQLVPLWGRNGPYALALSEGTRIRTVQDKDVNGHIVPFLARKKGPADERVMFWLRKSVTMQPDPTVLPDEDTLSNKIIEDMTHEVGRRWKGYGLSRFDEDGGAE